MQGDEKLVSLCQAKQKGCENTGWRKQTAGRDKSLASLHKATDTLSTMLAQEVKELTPGRRPSVAMALTLP